MNKQDLDECEQIQIDMVHVFKNKGISPEKACIVCLIFLSKFIADNEEIKEKIINTLDILPDYIKL